MIEWEADCDGVRMVAWGDRDGNLLRKLYSKLMMTQDKSGGAVEIEIDSEPNYQIKIYLEEM